MSDLDQNEKITKAQKEQSAEFFKKLTNKENLKKTFQDKAFGNDSGENAEDLTLFNRIKTFINKQMIKPDNPRLVNFRFIVTMAWYFDFGMTTFLISNYWYMRGDKQYENFIYHKEWFYYIIIVQVLAILSNFIVIVHQDHDQITLPLEIAKVYIKGNFVVDLISVFPYHLY